MSPIRGILGDFGITNLETGFSLGYLGPTLVLSKHDIRISLKLIQVFADTELRFIQILNLLFNRHVETYPILCLLFSFKSLSC